MVSTRPVGEVLATEATAESLKVVALTTRAAGDPERIVERLKRVLERACDAARRDTGPRPVPNPLYHALAGVLAWTSEVTHEHEVAPIGAIVVHESDLRIAFGHVGGVALEVRSDGTPFDVPWVVLLDPSGREARAFSVYSRRSLSIDLEWHGPGDPPAASAGITAEWRDAAPARPRERDSGFERPVPELEVVHGAGHDRPRRDPAAAPQGPPADVPRAPTAAEPRDENLLRWVDRLVAERHAHESATAAPAAMPAPAPDSAPERARVRPIEIVPVRPRPRDESVAEAGAEAARPDLETSPPGEPDAAAAPRAPRVARAARVAWPEPEEAPTTRQRVLRFVPITVLIAALFAGGWYVGTMQGNSARPVGLTRPSPLSWLGLGPPHFRCDLTSSPPGASISVDGKDLGHRTPAMLELPPGEHRVTLSLPGLGGVAYAVRGENNARVTLDAPLWGSLSIRTADASTPIAVTVDGTPHGALPITLERLAPGPHEVQYQAPGCEPWGEAFELQVNQKRELTARPFHTAASGRIDVRATLIGDHGDEDVTGAVIWVDGARAGTSPLSLELPRGPHSIRAEYRGEHAPVQVIDLPGGNERYASFEFGAGAEHPSLSFVHPPASMQRDRTSVVSVAIDGLDAGEVREMWLHVRTPEGAWRRYPMSMLPAAGGMVGAVVFPVALLDGHGHVPYYASALTTIGDEYFTELQDSDSHAVTVRRRS